MWSQKISIPSLLGLIGNSEGWGWGSKIFKGRYKPRLEFSQGMGREVKPQKRSVGGVHYIIPGMTHFFTN